MKPQTPLLVVCGPTASGKTKLSIELAKSLGGEIISADSMQIYRRMDIGTAKPTPEEMEGIPHHLLDFLPPGERFSVAQYVDMAKQAINDVTARSKLAVVTGGTGLYIDSLTRNIQFADIREDQPLRQELAAMAEEQGNDRVWELLQACDPALAEKLHPNNLGRIIRGIEVYRVTGITLSEWQRRSRLSPPDYRLCMLGITYSDRELLYRRIDQRVDAMLAGGLLEEVQALLADGFGATAGQAIGYKELFDYFAGKQSLGEAVAAIKQETRRYAKRQLTWLRRDERIHWLIADSFDSFDELLAEAIEIIKTKGSIT